MFFVFLFSTISIVSIIGSASIWDSDLDLSSNQVASSNLALSPLDPSASLFEPAQSDGNLDIFSIDSSDPLFENVEKNTFIPGEIGFEGLDLTSADGALTLDSSFDVADCSTSILFPAIGKSRIKRAAANSEKCKNPTSGAINNPPLGGDEQGPTGPDVTDEEVDEFFQNPAIRRLWFKAEDTENQNPSCHMISLGALPYGVCSSGSVADQSSVVENVVEIVGAGSFRGLTLAHCTLSTGYVTQCPTPPYPPSSEFCCCREYTPLLNEGHICVPIEEIITAVSN